MLTPFHNVLVIFNISLPLFDQALYSPFPSTHIVTSLPSPILTPPHSPPSNPSTLPYPLNYYLCSMLKARIREEVVHWLKTIGSKINNPKEVLSVLQRIRIAILFEQAFLNSLKSPFKKLFSIWYLEIIELIYSWFSELS